MIHPAVIPNMNTLGKMSMLDLKSVERLLNIPSIEVIEKEGVMLR
jgi:hypothetical protein